MKLFNFVALVLLPLSASAFEVSDVQLVRMMNGANVQCKETYEIGRDSYFPGLVSASGSDEAVTLNLKFKFTVCEGDKNERHWAERRPLDPISSVDDEGNPVRIEFRSPEFVFGANDSDTQQVVAVGNELEQSLAFRFPPADNLSPADIAALKAGKPVRVSTQLIYRVIGTAFTSRGEIPLGWRFSSSYTLFFTLRK